MFYWLSDYLSVSSQVLLVLLRAEVMSKVLGSLVLWGVAAWVFCYGVRRIAMCMLSVKFLLPGSVHGISMMLLRRGFIQRCSGDLVVVVVGDLVVVAVAFVAGMLQRLGARLLLRELVLHLLLSLHRRHLRVVLRHTTLMLLLPTLQVVLASTEQQ